MTIVILLALLQVASCFAKVDSQSGRMRLVSETSAALTAEPDSTVSMADASTSSIVHTLASVLYNGEGPWPIVGSSSWHYSPDHEYPHSNLKKDVVNHVLNHVNPDKNNKDIFWLECGSFVGNSAITAIKTAQESGHKISLIANDPFTGDVNMWAWNKDHSKGYDFLHQKAGDDGAPHIYEAFLSNIKEAKLEQDVLPLRASAMVGMKLLGRLHTENRLQALPDVIYLDSAHEKDETLMELQTAFNLLRPGGVLFGDDWGWEAVRGDVMAFSRKQELSHLDPQAVAAFGESAEQPAAGVVLITGQWIIPKATIPK